MAAPYLEVLTQAGSARDLLFDLNPWDLSGSENVNCPSAAAAVHQYLRSQGQTRSRAAPGRAFITTPDPSRFQQARQNFQSIIDRVGAGGGGHCVVVHANRAGSSEHFFNLVNIDGVVWWVDAGVRNRMATSQRLVPLAVSTNRMSDFSFTAGPFSAQPASAG